MDDESLAARHNEGKVDYALIPVDAMQAEARVWMMGEKKYGRHNWCKLYGHDTVNLVMQSVMRHACAILSGELIDSESGEHHAAHLRCNAAMLIRHYNESQGKDNTLQLHQHCTVELRKEDNEYQTNNYKLDSLTLNGCEVPTGEARRR